MNFSKYALLFTFFLVSLVFAKGGEFKLKNAKYAVLIEENSKQIVYSKNAFSRLYPASMTKMLTVYAAFKYIEDNKLSLKERLVVSKNAVKKGGYSSGSSTMFLNIGDEPTINEILQGIIVQSGNDAAITLAENLLNNEQNFVKYMSSFQKSIGLKATHFINVTGWPSMSHYSTPYDLSLIARAIIKEYPKYFHYFSQKEFSYGGVKQTNRNILLDDSALKSRGIIVDGMKTGHTEQSLYGLTFSAYNKKTGIRLIGVVSGLKSGLAVKKEAKRLIAWGFNNFNYKQIYKKGDKIVKINVWKGSKSSAVLRAKSDIYAIYPKIIPKKDVNITIEYIDNLKAPIIKGQKLAKLTINTGDKRYDQEIFLSAEQDITEHNLFITKFLLFPKWLFMKLGREITL